MLVDRQEILFDAQLKHAALARGPLPVGDPAALVADAVATLAEAHGEPVEDVAVTVQSADGVEAALIAAGRFDVAKALVLRRTVLLPDGPPVLGATGVPGVWLNLGHGSSGWALSCGSARVVADLMAARAPEIDIEGLGIERLAA